MVIAGAEVGLITIVLDVVLSKPYGRTRRHGAAD